MDCSILFLFFLQILGIINLTTKVGNVIISLTIRIFATIQKKTSILDGFVFYY